jgi:hypothetical protein
MQASFALGFLGIANDLVYIVGVYIVGVYIVGVYIIGVYIIGVYIIGVYIIGVYIIGVYLINYQECPAARAPRTRTRLEEFQLRLLHSILSTPITGPSIQHLSRVAESLHTTQSNRSARF